MQHFVSYHGNDLGAVYKKDATAFRVWAPMAVRVVLNLFRTGDGDSLISSEDMVKGDAGVWSIKKKGDLDRTYYTYTITNALEDGSIKEAETIDPYARAAGVNGGRGMVVDLAATDPEGFERDTYYHLESPTDAIICEVSVSDATSGENAGVKPEWAGKFLGLAQRGTRYRCSTAATAENANGDGTGEIPTGLDYLKSLGVTHLQLMPCYDFGSVDEGDPHHGYNWGYDPVNYNIPEGSYSTDPFHGEVRIKEFKELAKAIHGAGMGVIMDVVYNHTYSVEDNPFQKTVPDYYYRKDGNRYSNASACGNEVATDHEMCRKFIVDSCKYWVSEYHIDGFRFDLMGIFDMETMRQIADEVKKINPSAMFYGEGWVGGPSVLAEEKRTMKKTIYQLEGVGAFSDDIRDAVRGDVFISGACGFVSGKKGLENDIRFSVVGACGHPGVDMEAYTYSAAPWAGTPGQVINYVSCHDNFTLWDKLSISRPDASDAEKLAMNRLAHAIVMTSQGVPFFLEGEEMGRTKPVMGSDMPAENSYNLPLYTNKLRYERAAEMRELVEYYRAFSEIRRAHRGFRMNSAEEIAKKLKFIDTDVAGVVAFEISGDERLLVVYNAGTEPYQLTLPEGSYQILALGDKADNAGIAAVCGQVETPPVSAFVAVCENLPR